MNQLNSVPTGSWVELSFGSKQSPTISTSFVLSQEKGGLYYTTMLVDKIFHQNVWICYSGADYNFNGRRGKIYGSMEENFTAPLWSCTILPPNSPSLEDSSSALTRAKEIRQQFLTKNPGERYKFFQLEDEAIDDALLTCPITLLPMRRPVLTPDGYIYERKAIEEWLRSHEESPMTRQKMAIKDLVPYRPHKLEKPKHVLEISKSLYDSNITNTREIPKLCTELAAILDEKPLFDGSGTCSENSKVISLKSLDDARICGIFAKQAIDLLGDRSAWHIDDFGRGNFIVRDRWRDSMGHGLVLSLFDDDGSGIEPCSLDRLGEAYNQVLENVTTGWVSARLDDNPDIFFKKDPNEFDLFIKESPFREEDNLIRFLAKRFSVEADVHCSWQGGWRDKNAILWIRKSALADIVEKFGFKF